MIMDATGMGVADIALKEIIEDKLGWIMPELENKIPIPVAPNARSTRL